MSFSAVAASPVDEVILQAMRKPEDRIFFLQHEAQMVDFVHDAVRLSLELPPMNTYQRLLVRRCADQFRLNHQLDRLSHVVIVSKTEESCLPSSLLSDRAKVALGDGAESSTASSSSASTPPPTAASANFRIMRRDPSNGRARSSRDNSDSETITSKSRKDMTIQEREASYKAARLRIFGDEDLDTAKEKASPCASSSSLDVVPNRARIDVSDDMEFSRALPQPWSTNLLPPSQVQQSHSHPNLRAKAPAFHPPGYSTTSSIPAVSRPHNLQMNGVNAWAQHTAISTQQHTSIGRTSVPVRPPNPPIYNGESGSNSPAPSSTSSRQSSRNATKPSLASHPSLPAKPMWLQPAKESSTPSSVSASSSSPPASTLHNSTNVARPNDPSPQQ